MALSLIEAIGGREKAQAVGRDLGLTTWDARHYSGAFRFTRRFALTAMGTALASLNRERLGIELTRGIDEVSLALVADAWSRTSRARVLTFARSADIRLIDHLPLRGAFTGRGRMPDIENAARDRPEVMPPGPSRSQPLPRSRVSTSDPTAGNILQLSV